MPVHSFPDPRRASREGVVAAGGDLHLDTLRLAYGQGIFPWPHEGLPLLWFCPDPRAILPFDGLHVPRSLSKERRRGRFTFTLDRAFDAVIAACQEAPRPGQGGTWITPQIRVAYRRAHRMGFAHSVEAWDVDGSLAGGLYGIDGGCGVFSGESMFHRAPNASKLALLHLVDHLRVRGSPFLDIQQMTPHLLALGAVEIARDDFLDHLAQTRQRNLRLFDAPDG